ncbi:hypothetical protein CcaverHIS002_0701350 [Cutaneotrichosporon cavernicola]|uniref:Uncharacterized protein n=1 Tax=Cutaneotrichosporon cavernicola TaxID=279322 RepID=A0AA48L9U4_9TREE|nr:uncharacterized protein CcaverHIS019_0701370 [Cutaneotrichosporon cavernicola]BEI86789.1 hypothetical protein CcaverHIS002_0701350 [Cutaneotrichosporon cavernicola]BEI94565.1 hypothetical protein CcaverHIS019_0701370 [Cutaneotrichosporon cavernicola]BEJ02341.1 hypothetical protein CcaverHIS631_0701360 [Cutaneotrichosporon cavernicola]BEJ10100.1 hypothetical protein CcaverHIS641_0701350 [Cutaneotrichosporon cavernicola]
MSNPRVDPHPDKWLSAPKAPKSATQRPLVSSSFRVHVGIATPPTTTRKSANNSATFASGSTSRKRPVSEVTPTAPLADRNIQSYLTPPTSNTQPVKRLHTSSKLKNASHLHQSPTRRSPRLQRNRECDREDGIRERSVMLEAWRASVPPPALSPVKRLREVASPSPAPSFEIIEPPASLGPAHVPSSAIDIDKRLSGKDSRPQTVLPSRVETGRDSEAARAGRESARYETEAQRVTQRDAIRERKRVRLGPEEGVDENTRGRVVDTKHRRALGDFKSVAHHSSERSSSPRSSSPSERTPLASKNANALRRYSSAVVESVCARDSKWPKRQPAPRTPIIPSAFPTRSQVIPSAFPARLRKAPVESSQPSFSTKPTPASTTPPKSRIAHHHVTPPKSRTPQRRDQLETLFDFPPAPPRQPVFKPVSPKPISDWRPVEMQAETLMTWSMGGGAMTLGPGPQSSSPILDGGQPDDLPAPVDEDDDVIPETVPSQFFPNLVGTSSSPARPPQESHLLSSPPDPIDAFNAIDEPGTPGDHDECTPEEPSSPSPRRTRGGMHPPSSPPRIPASPSKSPTKPLVRHSKQDMAKRRRVMDHALFSSLSEASQAKPGPRVPSFPRPTQNRKTPPLSKSQSRKTGPMRKPQAKKSASSSKSQSKLEAFGYSRSSARGTREFDVSFSDEEDLDFGDADERDSSPAAGRSDLGAVPFAPPHPSLRPMGVREQAKRESAAMERHQAQRGSLSSSDWSSPLPMISSAVTDDSSSQSDERLDAQVSESTRAWWDGLEHDKSSDM